MSVAVQHYDESVDRVDNGVKKEMCLGGNPWERRGIAYVSAASVLHLLGAPQEPSLKDATALVVIMLTLSVPWYPLV